MRIVQAQKGIVSCGELKISYLHLRKQRNNKIYKLFTLWKLSTNFLLHQLRCSTWWWVVWSSNKPCATLFYASEMVGLAGQKSSVSGKAIENQAVTEKQSQKRLVSLFRAENQIVTEAGNRGTINAIMYIRIYFNFSIFTILFSVLYISCFLYNLLFLCFYHLKASVYQSVAEKQCFVSFVSFCFRCCF